MIWEEIGKGKLRAAHPSLTQQISSQAHTACLAALLAEVRMEATTEVPCVVIAECFAEIGIPPLPEA